MSCPAFFSAILVATMLNWISSVSAKLWRLGGDQEIWKAHYFERYVRQALKEIGIVNESLGYASKASRWLDHDHLIKRGGETDWKMQYKLRHNVRPPYAGDVAVAVAERDAIRKPNPLTDREHTVCSSSSTWDGRWRGPWLNISRLQPIWSRTEDMRRLPPPLHEPLHFDARGYTGKWHLSIRQWRHSPLTP